MSDPVLTTQILIVFGLLGLAVLLFVFDWLRVDLVGILMMIGLPLTGVLTGEEAIMGLSSNAVVSIIAVMIIGAGLNRTGIMNILAKKIIHIAGKGEARIMVVISATVSFISSFMQNIGAAALFLPATARISQQLRIPVSRLLMPMGFCAIIGGCLTLIGSSPLIMLNDLMESWWTNNSSGLNGKPFEPFGLFAVTPVGIALLCGGLIYFVLFGRFLLPKGSSDQEKGVASAGLLEVYKDKVDRGYELTVPEGFPVTTLEELQLRPKYLSTVVGIMKADDGSKNLAPTKDAKIGPGDIIALASTQTNAPRLAEDLGWTISEDLKVFAEDISPANFAMLEGIIPPRSDLSGHTLAELDFRDLYQVNPLAIYREKEILLEGINNTKLQVGDALLLAGPWEKFYIIKKKLNLVFAEELKGEQTVPEKAGTALFFLALALVLALGFKVKLSIALLTGAFGMILSRVLHIDDAYRAVDWMTIFLLAGLIPLGVAFEKTGAANYIAMKLLAGLGDLSPLVLMLTVAVLTSMFSLVASNVGATVLMVPLAMNMALQIGADPKMMALTVAVAASNTFILPTHQVNALVMRPGGYKTIDYMKAGFGMTFLYLIIQVGILSFLSSG
jgi:di/tricarboxylate transporter